MKIVKIVKVEWDDSCRDDGWMSRDSSRAKEHTISHCTSVGFILKKDKEQICIAQSLSDVNSVADLMAIPRKAVRKLTILGDSKPE